MKRRISILAALTSMSLAVGAGAAQSQAPTLRLLSRTPLAVKGAGFHSQDRVVVSVVTATGPHRKATTSSNVGAFVVRFAFRQNLCSAPAFVKAVDAHGAKVVLKVPAPLRTCPPPAPDA